jgi:predicted nucleotidyltransferase component of viral defense system
MGVGDVIVPEPERRSIQPQIEGYEAPEILTYSLESTIAEKFDAILQRFELTSRMKDFYDIYYLALTFDFEGPILSKAIRETLQNRKTEYGTETFNHIMSLVDDNDIQIRWRHFQKTIGQAGLLLPDIFALMDRFLHPVFQAVLENRVLSASWSSKDKQWLPERRNNG